jgi:hypothetical protein
MTFAELVAEVTQITKRPDLNSQIESAVKAATLKAHQSDYFFNDLIELAVEFDEARFIQTFDPKQVVPRFRQAKYIRLWEGDINGYAKEFLQHIQIEAAMDNYNYIRTNVFYMAGAFLQIRGTQPVEKVLFGAYQHPLITPAESYSSWIANEYPYAIIYEAARAIFLQIGFQEQSASMRSLVQEEYAVLGISNVDAVPT